MLRKYNHGQRLGYDFEQRLLNFFDYKWKTDRNYSQKTEADLAIMD